MNEGMGDTILLSGAIVELAKTFKMIVPCKGIYIPSTESIFADYDNICVAHIGGYGDIANMIDKMPCIKAGMHSGIPCLEPFPEWMYKTINIDLNKRWENCPVGKASLKVEQLPVPEKPYAFVAKMGNFGGAGNQLRVWEGIRQVEPELDFTKSILRYCDIIRNADEIHVIDSAFFHLTESLDVTGKCFYHHYARPGSTHYKRTKHNWNKV